MNKTNARFADVPCSKSVSLLISLVVLGVCPTSRFGAESDQVKRRLQFRAKTTQEAARWQAASRQQLFALMMGGAKPAAVPLAPAVWRHRECESGLCDLEEVSLQSLPDRRVHAWLAIPRAPGGKKPAVLALHGHGGSGEQIVKGTGLYWYGRRLAEMGYIVISPDIGSHQLQHANWSLMGERVWDALRCLDYLETRPEVDHARLAVCGLSLGGETTMYVAALDERVRVACSSGWLTTVENMKHGHCPCWNFPGLEEHFDFSDIFACVAPRGLICELGRRERAPGGFPVEVATPAFAELQSAYRVFRAEDQLKLQVHDGGHIFVGDLFWAALKNALGPQK